MDREAKRQLFHFNEGLLTWQEDGTFLSSVPVIHIDDFNGKKIVVVNWYDSERERQHKFHIHIRSEEIERNFAATTETFRVIFLGPAKDFPRESHLYKWWERNFRGAGERWIVFAAGPVGMNSEEGGLTPVFFVVDVILNAHKGKLIKPEIYSRPDIWNWASSQLFSGRGKKLLSFQEFLTRPTK